MTHLHVRAVLTVALVGAAAASGAGCSDDTPVTRSTESFCAEVEAMEADDGPFSKIFASGPVSTESSAEVEAAVNELDRSVARLRDAAPNEIAADVVAASEPFVSLISLMREFDFDFAAIDADPDAAETLQELFGDADAQAAGTRLEEFTAANCPTGS